MKYIQELKEMAERHGLIVDLDDEGEMEFTGTDKQRKAFQEEYDDLEQSF